MILQVSEMFTKEIHQLNDKLIFSVLFSIYSNRILMIFLLFFRSEELFIRLDNVFNGVTHLRSSLPSQYISDSGWLNSNEYFVRFNSIIRNLLYGKLLVGSLNKLNQISAVSLSFYDMYDNIIQDYNGQPLIYTSITQDLGQFLEFSQEGFDYSYARFLFRLLSNINFDPNAIFFHFAHPLITTSTSISTSTSTSISTSTTTSTSTSTWPGNKETQYFEYCISKLFQIFHQLQSMGLVKYLLISQKKFLMYQCLVHLICFVCGC